MKTNFSSVKHAALVLSAIGQSVFVSTGIAWAAKNNDTAAAGAGILVLLFGGAFYFLPTIIGFIRNKNNKGAILLLNLFLGWSLIGWVVALVWAVSNDSVTVQNIYVQQESPAKSGE